MRRVWPLAVVASLGTHGALLAGVALQWGAHDFAPQARPESRLNLATETVSASKAQAAKPVAEAAPVSSAAGQMVGDAAIPQFRAKASPPPTVPATAIAATGSTTVPTPLPAAKSKAADAIGALVTEAALNATPATQTAITGDAAPAIPPPSEHATASLAWTGDGALDPVSLAAIQAFMQPGDLAASDANAGRLRDGIAETLAAVPCARLQTSFDPDTGRIDLRGHLPEDALRAPVLAALQALVGSGIPVTDRLMLLPRPQCQALAAIADVGLAQSTEQDTNPRVVGQDTFVRDYSLTAGQRLVFDMTAPDYPAVIYVDYFDAAGNVLHMQPNDQVPATLAAPKSTLAVGQDAPGVPALQLIVGPPFGQEIAVAFAASDPLYDGVRPTIEPATAYLEFLKTAVAKARAANPGFKGEWVYFFVTTRP